MRSFLREDLEAIGAASPDVFQVTFSNGSTYRNRPGPARFSVRFRTRAAQLKSLALGHVGLLDAFFAGDIDVDGDLPAPLRAGMGTGFSHGKPLLEQAH